MILTKDNAQISSIKSNETIKLDNAFTIAVNPNVPNETKIDFVVTCSDGKETWETTFYAFAYSPVFAIESISTTPKIVKPGETGTMEIKFSNIGGATANDVIAEIFSSSSDVEFAQSTVLIDEVAAGENFVATAEFTISPSVLVGSLFEIVCSANADYTTVKKIYELKAGLLGDDFETGDSTANEWKIEAPSGASCKWVIDSVNAYEGKYCAKSDGVVNNKYAKLKVQLEVLEDGPLSFYVKTSSEAGYDVLEFLVNSLVDQKWSGEIGWTQYTRKMKKGSYALEWRYRKDTSGSEGDDLAYLDNICFPPISVVKMLESVKNLKYTIQNETVTLTWDAVESAEEYVVRRDGEIVATQTETSFSENVIDGIVTYTVVAKNGNHYSAPDFIVVNSNVESGENIIKIEDNKVSLYPNPTSGMLYIKLDNAFDAVVYNYQGQVVMREYSNDGQIDLSHLSTGIYFVEIIDGQNVMIEKVIVK